MNIHTWKFVVVPDVISLVDEFGFDVEEGPCYAQIMSKDEICGSRVIADVRPGFEETGTILRTIYGEGSGDGCADEIFQRLKGALSEAREFAGMSNDFDWVSA